MRIMFFAAFCCFFFLTSQTLCSQTQTGYAVFYADYLDGQATALGEIYRKDAMTCAHKYHAKGTLLKVTRLDNNRSVIVRVNDRGPYGEGLVVDVSKAAAKKLDLVKTGKARVKLEVIGKSNTNPGDDLAGQQPGRSYDAPAPVQPFDSEVGSIYNFENRPNYQTKTVDTYSETGEYYGKVKKQEDTLNDAERFALEDFDRQIEQNAENTEEDMPENRMKDITVKGDVNAAMIRKLPSEQSGYAIQLGSFNNFENARRQYEDYRSNGLNNLYLMDGVGEEGEQLHRIVIAAFSSEQKADTYLKSVKDVMGYEGLVIKLK